MTPNKGGRGWTMSTLTPHNVPNHERRFRRSNTKWGTSRTRESHTGGWTMSTLSTLGGAR